MWSLFLVLVLPSFSYIVSSVSSTLRGEEFMFFTNNNDNDWSEFSSFRERFRRNYVSLQELELRFSVFRQNLRTILLHNIEFENGKQNFTMGVNQFSDLTADEFKTKYVNNGKHLDVGLYGCKSFSYSSSDSYFNSNFTSSSVVDWRENGAVTSVKDQGQCGSCWAFSSTGAIEGAWAISKGQLVDFSEQQLVDCATGVTYGSHGCSGGQMDGAFKYVISKGQCLLNAYPYTAADGACQKCSAVAQLSSCSDVKANDQVSLRAAVFQQPVSVAIEADTRYFQSYSSGVLTSATCGTNLDHGVLVVGYGAENGINYWLVKNSWGTSWGENGYVKIGRSDSTTDAGICGIAMSPSFPSV